MGDLKNLETIFVAEPPLPNLLHKSEVKFHKALQTGSDGSPEGPYLNCQDTYLEVQDT